MKIIFTQTEISELCKCKLMKLLLLCFSCLFASIAFSQVQYLKEDFYNQKVVGSGQLLHPTSIRFDEIGQGYITLKRGVVRVVDTTGLLLPEPLIDISEEVIGSGDHGLVSIALDPNFLQNGFFYLLYSVDRHHLMHFGKATYDPSKTTDKQATIGRITRYQADASNNFATVIAESRKILVGVDIADLSFPILMASHGLGTLAFAEDGTLLASCGDAGGFQAPDVGSSRHTYFQQALDDGIIRPKDNVGAFRAQMPDNLAGKIVRLDPATGEGVPSNPYYDAANPRAPRSRVWSLGFRNPFRFVIAPETGDHNPAAGQPGTIYVGDVGAGSWEEVSKVTEGGQNFGWPLHEGFGGWEFLPLKTPNFDAPVPKLADSIPCNRTHLYFQDLFQEEHISQKYTFTNPCNDSLLIPENIPVFHHTRPLLAWNNHLWNKPTRLQVPVFDKNGEGWGQPIEASEVEIEAAFDGFSSMPALFYTEGDFPEELHHTLFVSDFSGWIKTLHFDDQQALIRIDNFMERDTGIVDVELHPKDGCMYYIHYNSHSLNKICFGGTPPPVASLSANQQFGPSPLEISFDASASYDPTNLDLTYFWDFGDGETSTSINPSHTFVAEVGQPTNFEVQLVVTNSAGLQETQTITVSPNNTPPSVQITSMQNGDYYAVSDITYLPLEAKVIDAEHSEEDLSYKWQTFLQHNTHFHEEPQITTATGKVLLEPTECITGEILWHRFRLTVTDKHGLSAFDEVEIYPYCEMPFFELQNLNAKSTKEHIALTWDITASTSVDRYEIQRTKDYRFETIGVLAATGNMSYQFKDTDPILDRNYYRIKAVHSDGAYEYSNQVNIRFPAVPEIITIYPNPTIADITVFTEYPVMEVMHFELYDPIGRLLFETTWDAKIGEQTEQAISLAQYNNGVYFYRVLNGETSVEGRLLLGR